VPEKTPDAAPPSVQQAESLQPGTYLQVIATIKSDAEVISKSLQDRRFPAVITPSSLEGRFRVLVGPYKDATSVGGAKSELENLGFHPIPVKMTEKN
jgi:cell division septation protein DedD